MILLIVFDLLVLQYLAEDDVDQYFDKELIRHGGGVWVAALILLAGNAFWVYLFEIPLQTGLCLTAMLPAVRWIFHDLYFNINALGWAKWDYIGSTARIDRALHWAGLTGWKQFIPKLAAFPVCWAVSYLIHSLLENWL